MKIKKHIAILFLTFSLSGFSAMDRDSLLQVWNSNSVSDSLRLEAIHDLAWSYVNVFPDSAIYYARIEESFSKELKKYKFEAFAYNTIGMAKLMQGEDDSALYYLEENCRKMERLGETRMVGISKGNIGAIYARQDRLYEALEYLYDAVTLFESINDTAMIISTSVNIGIMHKKLGEYDKALPCYFKALNRAIEKGNDYIQSVCYINLGSAYLDLKKPDSTSYYINKAIAIQLRTDDRKGLGNSYNILANNYISLNRIDSARYYAQLDLEIMQSAQDKAAIAASANILGLVYFLENNLGKSLYYHKMALVNAQESNAIIEQMQAHEGLYKIFEKKGNSKEAYLNYKLFIQFRDSLNSEDNLKALTQQEMRFQFNKKNLQDSLAYQEELLTVQAEQKKQESLDKEAARRNKVILLSVSVLVLLVICVAFVFYRASKRRKADNEIIARQKEEVETQKFLLEEKNHEIVDSITYAKRIQAAILPPVKLIQADLKDSFVFYQPKDIVAGDFYWYEKMSGKILIGVADCTGHGVPGALVSVVCHNALNRSVREFGKKSPDKILDQTRDLVIETFEKSEDQVKDGMDIALISLGETNIAGQRLLEYAGANNPIYIISQNELMELKPDKQPVGKFENPKPFEVKSVLLNKDDLVFLFSDGFADQFGGPRGKKLKYQALKNYLLENSKKSMTDLNQGLQQFFADWRGGLEQIDDVCIIGIRI